MTPAHGKTLCVSIKGMAGSSRSSSSWERRCGDVALSVGFMLSNMARLPQKIKGQIGLLSMPSCLAIPHTALERIPQGCGSPENSSSQGP